MNPIYSYKYLWLIEFLIFISLCNDILADNNRSRIKIPAPIETVKNYDIFKRTCEKFGFFPNKIGLYKRCIEMVWILEPNLNPSDMEEVAKNVKPWNISLVHARELLTNLIEYKWGVTEYGLFLQQLYKYPNRMNFVQNVMKAMPWEKWKLFCDVRFAKRFETYEMMPFILTSQERLEKLTEYMVWLHEKVNSMVKNRNSRRRRRRRNTVQAEAFGCPYSFVSAVIDLNKKKEGYDINQLYQGLCLDSLYEKWELDLFRKFCNEVGNSDIEGNDIIIIIMFGYKVVGALKHLDDSEKLNITRYNQYLKFCKNKMECMEQLSVFLENIFINTALDGQTLNDIIERCQSEKECDVMDLLGLLSTISFDIENISKSQRDCYKILVFMLYGMHKSDTTIGDKNRKILNIKYITEFIKIKKWNICDYNNHLKVVRILKMNVDDYKDFIRANSNEIELNKLTEILVYISKLEIKNIWTKLGKLKLKSNYKFVEILQWKDSPITIQTLKFFFNVNKPMDCCTDFLKEIISYNVAVDGVVNENEHQQIFTTLCPIGSAERIKNIITFITNEGLKIKNPKEFITKLKTKSSRKLI